MASSVFRTIRSSVPCRMSDLSAMRRSCGLHTGVSPATCGMSTGKAALKPRSPLLSSTPAERAELPHQPDLDQTHLECGGSTPLLHSIYNSGVLSREHFAERLHGRVALNGGATQRFPRKKWGPRLGPGAPKGAFQLPVSFSHRRVGSSILASLSEAGGTIREKCRASPFPLARLSTRIAIRNAPNDFPICTSRANGCETGL